MNDQGRLIYYSEMNSPIGPLIVARTEKGICWINFGKSEDNLFILKRWAKRWVNTDQLVNDHEKLKDAISQLNEYFSKERNEFALEIDLLGTPFQKLVWKSLLKIPYGEIRSYKDIAMEINAPKAVRAIGGANHNNPIPIIVPCHRVIGSNGNLVGYGGGINIKQFLLEMEGYKSNIKDAL